MRTNDPYLDDGMLKWIQRTAWANHRRIANFSYEDLVQEGYVAFYKCKDRYVGKQGLVGRDGVTPGRYLPPENPDKVSIRHFQALVKTTFFNNIRTLAWKQPSGWEFNVTSLLREPHRSESEVWDKVLPLYDEEASATVLLRRAPEEIKQLLQLLVDDAMALVKPFSGQPRRTRRERLFRRRETTNERFCRLLKLPENRDIVGETTEYFCGR